MSHTPFISALAAVASATQSPEPQLLDIDGTLFVQLGIFVVVSLLLSRSLWRPYLRVKSERIRRVDGYREDARSMDRDAQTRLDNVEAQLADARRVGGVDRTRARAEAQAEEQRLISQAQASAQRALVDAQAKVQASAAAERAGLMTRAAQLGREAAERVLGRKVTQ